MALCRKPIDVGDRYEVILPCLLWEGHEEHHETDKYRAVDRWAERVGEPEVVSIYTVIGIIEVDGEKFQQMTSCTQHEAEGARSVAEKWNEVKGTRMRWYPAKVVLI